MLGRRYRALRGALDARAGGAAAPAAVQLGLLRADRAAGGRRLRGGAPTPARRLRHRCGVEPAALPADRVLLGGGGGDPGAGQAHRGGSGRRGRRAERRREPSPGLSQAVDLRHRDGSHPGRLLGQRAQLVGDGEARARRARRQLLELVGDRVLGEELRPHLVVVDLLGMDDLEVELRGAGVAHRAAELDELRVAHLGDRFARERPGGDALDGGAQPAQVVVERAVPFRRRVVARHVLAQLAEALQDEVVVLHLVAALAREGHLDVDLGGGRHVVAGELARLDLALERELEERDDVDLALGLGFERLPLAELAEQAVHLLAEIADEIARVHRPSVVHRRRIEGWPAAASAGAEGRLPACCLERLPLLVLLTLAQSPAVGDTPPTPRRPGRAAARLSRRGGRDALRARCARSRGARRRAGSTSSSPRCGDRSTCSSRSPRSCCRATSGSARRCREPTGCRSRSRWDRSRCRRREMRGRCASGGPGSAPTSPTSAACRCPGRRTTRLRSCSPTSCSKSRSAR